ncbi:hypothetical protein LTR36_000748 [Oleoguttula mirabilis]|uniref:RNA helicase n=1 Tax=Oleoguttula mirabilis TaxID=1507867 RepID=A0AAV9JS36_9PEZI|nr:hypothetical protein LTR36_000748 [Oleoguttula mirabilis]
MALPTPAKYPKAPKDLFHPDKAQSAIHNLCDATKTTYLADVDFAERTDPRTEGNKSARTLKMCTLRLQIQGVCQEDAFGEGQSKTAARQAAYLHVLTKLHAKGALKTLLTGRSSQSRPETAKHESGAPLQDVQHWQKSLDTPTKQQYPGAMDELFEPSRMATAINNQAGRMKLSVNTDVDFSTRQPPKGPVFHSCEVKLEIQDMCKESGIGEGSTKQAAKQAAWFHTVAKLHASGVLKELFPDSGSGTVYVDEEGSKVQPTNLDQQTMDNEKDAKTEIYNYVAGLGEVPQFDVRVVQSRAARPSFRKQPKKPKPVFRVTISVPELNLQAAGAGGDLRTAEIAAAVAFKRMAEEQHVASRNLQSLGLGGPAQSSMLNIDTAKDFFVFLKDSRSQVNVEVENEQITEGGKVRHTARLTINGEATGQLVTMSTKKQATSIAYLTAAIETTKAEPTLLTLFQQRLRKDKGKVLQPVGAIDFPVDIASLRLMRDALVEARQAGLPDTRELLSAAEESVADEAPRRRRRQLALPEIEAISKRLMERQTAFEQDTTLEELRSKKASLPMNQYRAQVLDMVSNNAYSIVVGATGSGKTTQVPQIIIEDQIANGSGGSCNIICTQPRRIAATSVAQRVAVERNERLQQSVGYHVRFDAKLPQPGGSVTYCTTGILLQQLKHDPDMLDSVSHLIVDEVHERDMDIDFLMIVIKKALQARRDASKTVPKVVLMSATLDTELFARYFAHIDEDGNLRQCESISVPGRTFPVQDKYLGSIMHELLQSFGTVELNSLLDKDLVSQDYLKSETSFSARHSEATAASQNDSVIDWKRERQPQQDQEGDNTKQEKEEAVVPTALLAATIAHICKTTQDGAILAFVPGIDEILKTQRHLLERNIAGLQFGDPAKFKICLLHSTIPKEEQAQIFEPVAPGCRKIILSTNIAETSVTVTDVRYVVDAGKLRETRYDQVRRITKLQCVWESKSNSKQRAGRAGRVQNGYYYALFSKERHDSLRAVGLPELLRSDLQETCLSIKAQRFSEPVEVFLGQAIEPPPPQATQAALSNLKAIEAFTEDERLTDLGRLLARLPVHPTLGKMIVLGIIFRCLDPMLIFGAAANERSLFTSPLGREARAGATNARRSYAEKEPSDHFAMLKAFAEVRNLRDQYGMNAAFDRGRENFIHMGAFRTVDQTAKQIVEILTGSGLIPNTFEDGPRSSEYGPASLNRNSDNSALVQSLLLAGMYPNLAAKTTSKGSSYRTGTEQGVIMHPSSLNDDSKRKQAQDKHPYGTLIAYSALAKSNDGTSLFMRDTTLVTPLMSALFGGKLNMSKSYRLEMDDWLPFFVQASDRQFATKLVLEFRKALDRVLNSAFRSLAHVDAHQRTSFADDPMREQFASSVVQVLDQSTGRNQAHFWNAAQQPLRSSGRW